MRLLVPIGCLLALALGAQIVTNPGGGATGAAGLPDGMTFADDNLTIAGRYISTGPSLFDLSANATPGTPATDASRFAITEKNGPLKQYDDTGALFATHIRDADKASQAEAEAGTDNDKFMTPLRTAQAITAQASGGLPSGRMTAATSIGATRYAAAHCPGVELFGGAAANVPNPPAYVRLIATANSGCVFLLPELKPAGAGAIDYWVEVGASIADGSPLNAFFRIETVCTSPGDAWNFTGAGTLNAAATGTAFTFADGSSINSMYLITPADEGSSSPTLDTVSLAGCATNDVVGFAVWRTPLHANDTLEASAESEKRVSLYGIRYQYKE